MEARPVVVGKKKGGARPGCGRKPGIPNKYPRELREMIFKALEMNGGVEYLARQAKDNPGPFMTLIGKILPPNWVAYDPENATSGKLTIKWES